MTRAEQAANLVSEYLKTGNLNLIFSEDVKMKREIYKQLASKSVIPIATFVDSDFMVFRTRAALLTKHDALTSDGKHAVYTGKSRQGVPLWVEVEEKQRVLDYLDKR